MLEQSVKLLGEDQRVRAERVSAECGLPEADDGLHLTRTGALKRFARLLNTAGEEIHLLVSFVWRC